MSDYWERVARRVGEQRNKADEATANLLTAGNPQDARKARVVARRLDIPPAVAEADLPGFEAEDEMERNRQILNENLGLATFVSDASKAAASKDSLPQMDTFSRLYTNKRPAGAQWFDPENPTKVPPVIGRTAPPPPAAPRRATTANIAAGLASSSISAIGKVAVAGLDFGAELIDPTMDRKVAGAFERSDWRKGITDEIKALDDVADVRYSPLGTVLGKEINPGQWAYGAATSGIQMLGAIATRNPLTVLATISGSDQYLRSRERGAGFGEAAGAGVVVGAIEAATEKLPLDFLTKRLGKTAVGKFVSGYLVPEFGGEIAATIGQNFVDAMTTGGVGWDQYVANLPQDIVDTIGTTAFLTGGIGTLNAGLNRLARGREARQMEEIANAIASAAWVDNLMTTAADTPLRQQDPETFREYVEQITQDSPVRDLFVPAKEVRALMQEEGYDGSLDAYAEQVAEAEALGGDVVIPIAEAAATLAGTPTWEALKDKARVTPGGLSQKEALTQRDEIFRNLEQRGNEIADEVGKEGEAASAAALVYEDAKNRLLAGGRPSKEAENAARLIAAHYETVAARKGITPMEAWQQSGIVFGWEQGQGTAQREMAQGGTVIKLRGFKVKDLFEGGTPNPMNPRERVVEGGGVTVTAGLEGDWHISDLRAIERGGGRRALEAVLAEADRSGMRVNLFPVPLDSPGGKKMTADELSNWYKSFGFQFDPNNDERMIREPAGRDLFQSAQDLAEHVPGFENILPYLEQDERDLLKKRGAERIVELVETFPDAEEMAAVAFSGRAKRGWYERSAAALLDIFGAADAARFAALLAATSPQTSVESNTINALNIWVNWDAAGRPTDLATIKKIMGKSVQGRKGEGSILDSWINNTFRALSADNPADIKLSGPKVNSFMLNLVGVVDEVTNDAWMANYALIDQEIFRSAYRKENGEKIGGKSPGYIAFSAVVRRAAEILTKKTGETWTPSEVQETVWSWTKVVTETRVGSGETTVQQLLDMGGVSHEDISTTPDFAALFQMGVYRRILEAGGYGQEVEFLAEVSRQTNGSPRPEGVLTDAEGSGFDPETFRGHLLTAGERIEERTRAILKGKRERGQRKQLDLFDTQPAPTPLEGLPALVKVDGIPVAFGPFAKAREAARRYALKHGIPHQPPTEYAKVDPERAARIAEAFEAMEHNPKDPETRAAYEAMKRETLEQFKMIQETGLQIDFIKGEDPYGNPRNAIIDVVENNHLWVFPTDDGFGSGDLDVSDNPLLEFAPGVKINGKKARYNDVFRIVHDYYGHIMEGVGFRADGEENAWRIHSAMYSPLARRAMTTETRGQNSWVNFGPYGEKNRTASGSDTVYAPQKIGLLPDWVVEEGSGQRVLYQDGFVSLPSGRDADPVGQRIAALHGTPFEFERFDMGGKAVWFAEGRNLAQQYANPRRFRKSGEGRIIEAELTINAPLDLDVALATLPSHHVVENPVEWVKEQFGFDLKEHGWEKIGQDYASTIFRSRAFAEAARAAGYDALAMTEQGTQTWGMLNEGSVVSPDGRELYQSEPFYSALARAVENSKTTKAPGAQWLATLRKTPGVKQEELEWSGLLEVFDTFADVPIEKKHIEKLLADGGVQIEEVVLGADPFADEPQRSEYPDEESWWNDREEWYHRPSLEAQFRSWSSDPSNETYRELLITLPVGVGRNPTRAPSTHWDTEGVVAHARFMDKLDADGKRVLFIEEVQSDWHQKGRDEGYEVPKDLVAVRKAREAVDERRRVWEAAYLPAQSAHSAARPIIRKFMELGNTAGSDMVVGSLVTATMDVIDVDTLEIATDRVELANALPADEIALLRNAIGKVRLYRDATDRLQLAEAELRNANGDNGGIPNAPFKSSWPALAMKRMIRWAAENGYDRVAWTTGAEQASRYNLSQAVGSLTLEGMHDSEGYRVRMGSNGAAETLAQNGLGQIVERGYGDDTIRMTETQMREAFGNDITKRLLESDGEKISGEGLTVGGEGMKAFYDRNLVNITNDIIKKYGVKVGKLSLTTDAKLPRAPEYLEAKETHSAIVREIFNRGGQGGKQRSVDQLEALLKVVPGHPDYMEAAAEGYAGAANNLRRIIELYDQLDLASERLTTAEKQYPEQRLDRPGFDITPELREAAMGGFALFQGPRGRTRFMDDGRRIIDLFAKADESTLVHELAHVWLEEIRAEGGEDWAALKKWWKGLGIEFADDAEIPTAAHEYFARGFERYMREGRAPVSSLRAAFKVFGDWLTKLYKTVRELNAPINNSVREVFDRMLATQEAIDEYRKTENAGPLFNNAEEAGMTEAEFAAYERLVANARDNAYDTMLEKVMAGIRAKRAAAGRERRNALKAEVASEINEQPAFIALHLLRTGMWLGDPDRPKQDVKLNTGWLIDTYGEEILDKLPRGLPITKGDGLDGDAVAEMVGLPSGTALVDALVDVRTATDVLKEAGDTRSLRAKLIDDEIERRIEERGEEDDVSLDEATIREEAIAALNTSSQGEVIAAEIQQLRKRATRKTPMTPYQFAREWAKRKVQAGRVNDVASRSAVQRYTRATAKAARLAEEAILKGDVDEAYRQKQAQLLNHALLAESKAAADAVDSAVRRMRKLGERAAMKSIDPTYLSRIHQMLEGYDLRERSQRSIDEQQDFQQWAEAQRAKGFEVHIPPRLENAGEPYTRVTVEELLSLNDLIQSLVHLGRLKQRMKTAQEERDFAELIDEMVALVEQLPQRKLPEKPINEEERWLAGGAAELIKIEALAEELDGGPTGPFNDLLVTRAMQAENHRRRLRDTVLAPIVNAYKGLSRKMKKRLQEKVTLNELTWNTLNEGDPRLGTTVTITRGELLSIALNMGNLSNLEKLSKGERWPVDTLKAIVDRELTKEDWDFVQLLWDQVNSLWPDIVAAEREMSGVIPEQVTPSPIQTRFGEYQGGYWPVSYDANRWQRAEDLEDAKLDDMFGLKSGVATQKGHTVARTAAFGPINLSLEGVLFSHLEQVVTRISHTAYARDVLRVFRNPRVRGIIDTRLGREYRRQVEPWLGRVIHSGAVNDKAARWWEKLLRQARINMMVAAMGLRFSTGVAQTLGLTASAHRIGARWVATGLKRLALHPRNAANFAFERSPELVNRNASMNREVAEVFNQLKNRSTAIATVQAWAFWHIGMIDRYVVALPTWLGAHAKGISEGMTDAEASAYADKSVRMSQGSGEAKDLAKIQDTGSEAFRFFTMFYTPFNVMFQAQWQAVRGLKKGNVKPLIGVTFWWMIVSTLADALVSGDFPDGDDDDDGRGDEIAEWFARNVFFGAFAGIPLVRDVATTVERKISDEYSVFGQSPVDKVYDTVERAWETGDKWIEEGEAPDKPLKRAGDLTAILTGLPTSQLGTSGQFLWDYSEGEVDPQTKTDWYFGVTRGKEPAEEEAQ